MLAWMKILLGTGDLMKDLWMLMFLLLMIGVEMVCIWKLWGLIYRYLVM